MNPSTIAENIQHIRERIAIAAEKSGRSPNAITLIAVTKTVPAERVAEAMAAGVTDFGENYVQEARAKIPTLTAANNETNIPTCWHLIGHLQSNKVKYCIELFSLIHSVDNYQLVQEISRQAAKRGKTQEILIEVDLTGIAGRNGVGQEDFPTLVEKTMALPHVALRGIMGIAPPVETPEDARPYFAGVRALYETLPAPQRQVLSLGMSGDFEAAIAEGATHVRIGSAIFGDRLKVR